MSRSSLFFVLAILGHGTATSAAPLRIDVRLAGATSASKPVAVLRVTSQTAPEESRRASEPLEITVPGQRKLDLGLGIWRIQAEAAGYWSEEQVVSLKEGQENAVELLLFPTGLLRARIEMPRGMNVPGRLDVRFGPAPGSKRKSGIPEGVIPCPVRADTWECPAPAGTLDLRLRGEGLVPLYRWGVSLEAGKILDLGVLAFRPGASVVGQVVNEAGLAVVDTPVELSPELLGALAEPSTGQRLQALSLTARTNERGFFQFEGVAPGTYAVTASGTGMALTRVSPVLVREGLEAQILDPLVLARPVTVRVDLSPPVDPYGNVWKVRLLKESNAGGAMGTAGQGIAGKEGRWTQGGLAPGRYRLQILGDLESRWIDREIEVSAADPTVPIDIPVVEVQGRLRLGDDPLSGTLWFGGGTGARKIRFDADEDGEFEGFLPEEGTWPLDLVSEEEGLRLALEPVEIRVPKGKRAAQVEIRVPDTTLEGEVVDESGRAVAGAVISFTGSRKVSEVNANDEGRFRIRGLKPPYAFVEAEEGDRTSGPVQALLEDGSKSPWLRLVLRANLEVRGRVTSAAGPVPGAEVMAWPSVGEVPFASDDSAVTGPDGGFSLRFPAKTRSLALFVSAPGHAFHMARVSLESAQPLEIPIEGAGGKLVLDRPGPGSSALLVHGGTFAPLPILAGWADRQRTEQSDPGKLVIPNVESGGYSLCRNAGADLRQGKEPPSGICVSGVLAPNGELSLSFGGQR
jgi:hypothetical protein